MKTISQTYTIELTKDDIHMITTALHGQYKHNREMLENDSKCLDYIKNDMTFARNLRNSFANLIGVQYMGEDN